MKKLLFSAVLVLLTVLCLVPILHAQEAVGGIPRPSAAETQETPEPVGADAAVEKSAADEPDYTDPEEALKEIRQGLRLLRQRQADMGADMTSLADQVHKLRGELEEMSNPERQNSDRKDIQARLDDLAARMRIIENLVGAGKPPVPVKEGKREVTQAAVPDAAQEGKLDLKEPYLEAFNDFKSGKYDVARRKFQAFLKQFPDASLASGAQFWIGECYYKEESFEKAILEYDKVLLNYPKGEMVPHALLKQGLSFLKIGDKTGARIVLEKLSNDYPNTDQANIARSTLATLK